MKNKINTKHQIKRFDRKISDESLKPNLLFNIIISNESLKPNLLFNIIINFTNCEVR